MDKFVCIGHDPVSVGREANALESALNERDLKVHEGFSPSTEATFAGIEFDGIALRARVPLKRAWRSRLAFDFILESGEVSGCELEVVVGHFTWAALARREVLSFLGPCLRVHA